MFKKKTIIIVVALLVTLTTGFLPDAAKGAVSNPILVGMYPSKELYTTVDEINTYDADFGGDVFSIAGTFIGIESPDWFINAELAAAWNNGYIPFVNLGTEGTAEQVATGAYDTEIRNWANLFEFFAKGLYEDRRAFLAPLQENNGGYTAYSGDPENFIKAYLRIQQIFLEEGVPEDSVSWVYAPNGWHNATTGYPFEEGYPGDSAVDVVAFSSFNWGDCWTYTDSQGFEKLYKPYLDRMRVMAPGKPIMIAEIGSVTEGLDRGAWFQDILAKIGSYPAVTGILYFSKLENTFIDNDDQLCEFIDHSLSAGGNEGLAAFEQAVTQPPYGYWGPSSVEMTGIAFDRLPGTFEDVWPASNWAQLTSIYYQTWVERLATAGITGGCRITAIDLGPVTDFTYRYYCPEDTVTRAAMAVFLERGINGSGFKPPDVAPSFGDTIGHWAEDWIEALADDGITAGCGNGNYCPDSGTTRAQMAIFLLRGKYGPGYSPAPASGTMFGDVPLTYWAASWIEALATEGITSGCGNGNYCPDAPVTRGQMAVFLVTSFNLP